MTSVAGADDNTLSFQDLMDGLDLAGKYFLKQREQLNLSSRFCSTNVDSNSLGFQRVDAKVERTSLKQEEIVTVKLLHVMLNNIGRTICGRNIVIPGLYTCFASVVPDSVSYTVHSHANNAIFFEYVVYVQTKIVAGKRAIYLSPSLLAEKKLSKFLPLFLNAKRSVEV